MSFGLAPEQPVIVHAVVSNVFLYPVGLFVFVGGPVCVCVPVCFSPKVPKAKELFEKASGILGYDLLEKCKTGPKDVLDSTVREKRGVVLCDVGCSCGTPAEAGRGHHGPLSS